MPAVKKSGKAATLKVMRENLQDLAGAQVPSLQQRRSTTTSLICQKSEADQDKDVNSPPVVQDKQVTSLRRGRSITTPSVCQQMPSLRPWRSTTTPSVCQQMPSLRRGRSTTTPSVCQQMPSLRRGRSTTTPSVCQQMPSLRRGRSTTTPAICQQMPSLRRGRSKSIPSVCQNSEGSHDKEVKSPPVVHDKQADVTAACTLAEEQRGSEVPVPAVSQEMEDGRTPMPFQKPTGSTDSRGSVSYPDSFYTGRDPV